MGITTNIEKEIYALVETAKSISESPLANSAIISNKKVCINNETVFKLMFTDYVAKEISDSQTYLSRVVAGVEFYCNVWGTV